MSCAGGAQRGTHAVLESDGRSPQDRHESERLYEGNLTFIFAHCSSNRAISIIPTTIFDTCCMCYGCVTRHAATIKTGSLRATCETCLSLRYSMTSIIPPSSPGRERSRSDKHPDRNRRLAAIRNACRSCFSFAIETLIEATHYPYKIGSDKLDLLGQIIRDADFAQALNPAWIQQVVFGLAQEWEVSPLEVLKGQGSFLACLSFSTCWAEQLFPPELIQTKVEEVEQLLRLLDTGQAVHLTACKIARPLRSQSDRRIGSGMPLFQLCRLIEQAETGCL
jgi:hypothetical protein